MFSQLVTLGALASVASASIFMTSPVASTECSGGKVCQIKWQNDAKTAPNALSAYGPMTVGLYVGNVAQQTLVQDLGSVDPDKVNHIDANIPATAGPNGDFYFIRFQQVNPTNAAQPLQAFSAKFTLDKMTGQLSPAASAQIAGVTSAAASSAPASTGTPATTPSSSSKPGMVTVSSSSASSTAASSSGSASASARASASGSTSGASGVSVAKGLTALAVVAGAMGFFA